MRIALIRQRYVPHGGAERYLDRLATEFVKRGLEVHIFAHRWEQRTGIQFHHVPMIRTPGFLRALSFAWNVRHAVANAQMDLVFSFERTLQQDIYRAGDGCHREWLHRRTQHVTPWKARLLRINPLHHGLLWLERQALSPAHTGWVIANSERGKNEIVRHYQFPAERITVIHNGVDTERFQPQPRPRPADTFVLLYVGSGFERKGLEFAIRALPSLPAHVRLRVIGHDNPRPYQHLASELRLEDRIEFRGTVPMTSEVYAQADLLVHPALYEPFGNVCLEAMACGIPVVTTCVCGASEIITNGHNGAVIEDPSNLGELAAAIRPFLDESVRAPAALRARQTAESMSFTTYVGKALAVLDQTLAGKGRPPIHGVSRS